MKQRLAIILAATALAVTPLGSAPVAHGQAQPFVPGVTDVPTAETLRAKADRPVEPFVPGLTDAPAWSPATTPSEVATGGASGTDSRGIALAGALGAALAALLVGSAFLRTRRAAATRAGSIAAR